MDALLEVLPLFCIFHYYFVFPSPPPPCPCPRDQKDFPWELLSLLGSNHLMNVHNIVLQTPWPIPYVIRYVRNSICNIRNVSDGQNSHFLSCLCLWDTQWRFSSTPLNWLLKGNVMNWNLKSKLDRSWKFRNFIVMALIEFGF